MLRRIFSNPIDSATREQVINLLIAEWRLAAIQDAEGARFNELMVQHGSGLSPGSESARIVASAARQMSGVYKTLVDEHGRIGPVPNEAGRVYYAWHVTYLALWQWAAEAAAAYTGLAEGNMPAFFRVQLLLAEQEKQQKKAFKEESKLMKSIRLTAEEVRQIMLETDRGE